MDNRPPVNQEYPQGSVECRVCGREFKSLYRHLHTHGLSAKEYRIEYPGAATVCAEIHEAQRQGGAKGNRLRVRKPLNERRRKVAYGGAPELNDTSPVQEAQIESQGASDD